MEHTLLLFIRLPMPFFLSTIALFLFLFFTAFCDVFSGALNIIILLIHTAGWFIPGGFGLVLVRPAHLAAQAASLSSLSSVGGNGVLV